MRETNENKKNLQYHIRSIINFLQGIAFTLFILTITFAIILIIIYNIRQKPLINYAIVFDAGSSHTEMFVYYWPADKSKGLGTTSTVNELFVCPIKEVNIKNSETPDRKISLKAISDFEQNLDLLNDYFQPCLSEAISKIPSNRHKFSPIFLGATAGMRLARLTNVTRAKQVLETIREIFSNSPFQFVISRQVRILTGMEEAIDGWITTNILLEKFKHRHEFKHSTNENFDSDMVGVLDLGGASTQITFTYPEEKTTAPIPLEFKTSVTLFDTVYSPYAYSYLCWGKNEALKRYRARLLNSVLRLKRRKNSNSMRFLIRDWCLPPDTNDTLTIGQVFNSPCSAAEKADFEEYKNITSVTYVGYGNATLCRQRLIDLFDSYSYNSTNNSASKPDYLTFNNTFQPNIPKEISFIGLSGYYYVFNNLAYGMKKPRGSSDERYDLRDFSISKIKERMKSVCHTRYSILYQQESMKPSNERHKRMLCFDSWYMWLLLTHAIGFREDDLNRLSFANTLPSGKVGWTLGYMINQTNYIPAEYRERIIKKSNLIIWLLGLFTIALIGLLFILLTFHKYCKTQPRMPEDSINSHMRPFEGTPI